MANWDPGLEGVVDKAMNFPYSISLWRNVRIIGLEDGRPIIEEGNCYDPAKATTKDRSFSFLSILAF